MTLATRIRKFALLPCSVAVLAVMVGASSGGAPKSACEIAAEWVADNHGTLPKTLTAYSEFSELYRRAIYQLYSPETRIAFWREHLASFLQPGTVLTPEQQAVVRNAQSKLAIYLDANKEKARAALEADGLSPEKVKLLFGIQLGKSIFVDLGTGRLDGRAPGLTIKSEESVQSSAADFETEGAEHPYCSCSTQSDWCDPGCCSDGGNDCLVVPDDCGTFLQYDCDGLCYQCLK